MKLSTLIENPDNPQTVTDEDYKLLVESLRSLPQTLEANKIAYVTDYVALDGRDFAGRRVVIAGNKRLRALKEIHGEKATLPDRYFFDLTPLGPEARRQWLVKSNVQSGDWDAEKLLALYDQSELASLMGDDAIKDLIDTIPETPSTGETDPDAVPEAPAEIISKRGEIYALGQHRLMCGDSTASLDFGRLMRGELADMVFTDPPYGVAVGDKNKELNELQKAGRCTTNIANDTLSTEELYNLLKAAFINTRQSCADDACYFVTAPQGGSLCLMMMMMRDAGLAVRHVLMWCKNSPTFSIGRLDYDYQHEPIFYTWTKSHHNYRKGEHRSSIWNYDKPRQCDLHPTMKPVALVKNAILDGTLEGNIVLDPFGGSGTTIIACEQLGRRCRMMEIDPHYCDVIRRRWAEFVHGEGCDWRSLTPEVSPDDNH